MDIQVIRNYMQELGKRYIRQNEFDEIEDVEIISGAWNDGYDNGDGGNNGGLDIDAKGNNMWDGWDD